MAQEKTLPKAHFQADVSAAALLHGPSSQGYTPQKASAHLEIAASWVGNRRREVLTCPFYPQTAGSPL